MKPSIVVLFGGTNTGKSRIFNALCGQTEALVAKSEHVTRDWRESKVALDFNVSIRLRDTAGALESYSDELTRRIQKSTEDQIRVADLILFVVDTRAGLTLVDENLARMVRKCGRPVVLVLNKIDTISGKENLTEFYNLGFPVSVAISAELGIALDELRSCIYTAVTESESDRTRGSSPDSDSDEINLEESIPDIESRLEPDDIPSVVVCGLSNSGKSTLINRLAANDRLIVHDKSGTTREPIGQNVKIGQNEYRIYDTCGFIRHGDILHYLSTRKTKKLLHLSHLSLYLIDGAKGPTRMDSRHISELLASRQDPLIVCNKADLLDKEHYQWVVRKVNRWLCRMAYPIEPIWVSATKGFGLDEIERRLTRVHRERQARYSTHLLTNTLQRAIDQRPPPTVDSRRIRLRLAHQGGGSPLTIVIHGKQTNQLNHTYLRYLSNFFREELGLRYSIPRISLRRDDNPYATPMRR